MKYVFWIGVVVALCTAGWRIVGPDVTNVIFQDEVQDTAAQLGWRTGSTPLNSDEDLRNIVIHKAKKHQITLDPKQITVRHGGTEQAPTWFIAVDYQVNVDLLMYSYALHFNPTSNGGGKFWGSPEPAHLPSPTKALPKASQQRPDQTRDTQRTRELKEIPPSLRGPQ
jgi:hypothetical protein